MVVVVASFVASTLLLAIQTFALLQLESQAFLAILCGQLLNQFFLSARRHAVKVTNHVLHGTSVM